MLSRLSKTSRRVVSSRAIDSPTPVKSRAGRSPPEGAGADRLAARFLPGGDAAGEVADPRQAHVRQRLRSERRAAAAGAEEHQPVAAREHRVVERALGVRVEFEEAARRVDRAGDRSRLAFVLPADVDELALAVAYQRERILDRHRLDRGIGLRQPLLTTVNRKSVV